MPAVSNTSPLSNLAIIDRLEILRGQLGQIDIPVAVQLELDRLSHADARLRLALSLIRVIREIPGQVPPVLQPKSLFDRGLRG